MVENSNRGAFRLLKVCRSDEKEGKRSATGTESIKNEQPQGSGKKTKHILGLAAGSSATRHMDRSEIMRDTSWWGVEMQTLGLGEEEKGRTR